MGLDSKSWCVQWHSPKCWPQRDEEGWNWILIGLSTFFRCLWLLWIHHVYNTGWITVTPLHRGVWSILFLTNELIEDYSVSNFKPINFHRIDLPNMPIQMHNRMFLQCLQHRILLFIPSVMSFWSHWRKLIVTCSLPNHRLSYKFDIHCCAVPWLTL